MYRIFVYILILLSSVVDCSAFTRYVTNNLNLRYEANAHSYILTVIPKGTAVTIDEDCDCKWVPVEYKGYVGYISTRYLSKTRYRKSYTSYRRKAVRSADSYNRRRTIRYYTNVYGNRVQSPTYYETTPNGASALCRDGTYSFSQSRRGTCSHHGGVARWYY